MRNDWIYSEVLVPALAAQLFCVVLAYLMVVRKRMTSGYRLYALFLFSFILLLAGRVFQYFVPQSAVWYVNWARVSFFMSVGIPSLFIVSAQQAGWRPRRALYRLPFLAGILLSIAYVFCHDTRHHLGLFPASWGEGLPFEVTQVHSHWIWWFASLGMLAIPNTFFLIREWTGRRNQVQVAFTTGAVLFGFLMALGALNGLLGIYYVGSMVSALIWAWAMFQHVRQMKGRIGLLKEELEWQFQAGQIHDGQEIESKLVELEHLSDGDLAVYKLRIREILSALTDATIRAGADSVGLLERTAAREKSIELSLDPQTVRNELCNEAVELSGIISEIQQRKETVAIRKAKRFIEQEFSRDLGVDEIAKHLGLSRAYLMREFKQQTGSTINQHLTRLRIEKAQSLLPSKTVTETAFEVGYNHANYFSTVFKKQTGVTPAEYKKSCLL